MAALLNSCKKVEEVNSQQKQGDAKNSAMNNLRGALTKNPEMGNIIYPLNLKKEGYYAYFYGNRIDVSILSLRPINVLTLQTWTIRHLLL